MSLRCQSTIAATSMPGNLNLPPSFLKSCSQSAFCRSLNQDVAPAAAAAGCFLRFAPAFLAGARLRVAPDLGLVELLLVAMIRSPGLTVGAPAFARREAAAKLDRNVASGRCGS